MKGEKTIKNIIEETRQEKVIVAAKFFFKKKSCSSYKTWDIEEYNEGKLSLANFYFLNKERIFNHVIFRNTIILYNSLNPVLNDRKKTAAEKIEFIVLEYINLLLEKPDFAIFLLNELLSETSKIDVIVMTKEELFNSYFLTQFLELKKKKKIKNNNPAQLLLNLIGMILLPLVNAGLTSHSAVIASRQLDNVIYERKKLLPLWISTMVQESII